jgi:hypothetical protein
MGARRLEHDPLSGPLKETMENQEREFRQRAALLMEALRQLPPDAMTLSALFDVAVSAAIAVTLDPSSARLMFEAKLQEYECRCVPGPANVRLRH